MCVCLCWDLSSRGAPYNLTQTVHCAFGVEVEDLILSLVGIERGFSCEEMFDLVRFQT